ncbi:MAG: winged helix-turn-helix domain-containing protein [Bacteroidaceae bacterium]|nr:winged helix-turn-helix domain-containing protein [Bacteroidaceae bacterium]MDY6249576.1 winged helix-turn-helix domain-containing protein [Bacteroidaceae bacterium]
MLQENTGVNAGNVWNALNENGALNVKDLKKAAGLKNEKELFLALGWLLREDNVVLQEEGKEVIVSLK